MDDPALLRAYCEQRSEAAFRALVQRHLPVVHAAALRQVNGDAHLAQDVAQRVFISLARKATALTRQPALVGWLYTATRLEAARAVRTEQRRRRRDKQAAMDAPESAAPSFEPLAPLLDAAMSELPDADREAVLLRYFSSRSYAEIGGVLRISEEAARKRVDRALTKLQEALRRRGFASTAAALGGVLTVHAAPAVLPSLTETVAAAAGANVLAGNAVSLGLIMTSTKTLLVIVGVAVAAGAWLWHDHLASQRIAAAHAAALSELAAAETRLHRRTAELETARQELARAEAATAPAPTTRAAAPAYLTDPAYRELARASSRARRHLEFQPLYRQLRLTPAQVDAFESAMARQDEAQLDAAVARAVGQDERAVFQRSGAEWSDAMRGLLGETGFAQLQEYLRSMPVRAFLDRFAVQSAALGTPVTPEQTDQLAALALAHDVMYAQGKGTDPGTVNWNEVWDPAGRLLSADQIALLQRSVEVWSLKKQVALALKQGGSRP